MPQLRVFCRIMRFHLAGGVILVAGLSASSALAGTIAAGDQAPEISLTVIGPASGAGTLTTKALRGRNVVLEFWATWCGPCIGAIDHWNSIAKGSNATDIAFVAVSDEPESDVRRFLRSRPIAGTIAVDSTGAAFDAFGVDARPTTVLVDKAGLVRWIGHPNALTADLIRALGTDGVLPTPQAPEAGSSAPPLFEASVRPSVRTEFALSTGPEALVIKGLPVDQILSFLMGASTARFVFEAPRPESRYDVAITRGDDPDSPKILAVRALESAFGWKISRETRLNSVYVLGRGSFSGKAVEALSTNVSMNPPTISGVGSVGQLLYSLETVLHQPIVDGTGLTGAYQWDLNWQLDSVGSVLEAVRSTGLSIIEENKPVEMVVIRKR